MHSTGQVVAWRDNTQQGFACPLERLRLLQHAEHFKCCC